MGRTKASLTNAGLYALLRAGAVLNRVGGGIAIRVPGAASAVAVGTVLVVAEIAGPAGRRRRLAQTNTSTPNVVANLTGGAIRAADYAILLANAAGAFALVFSGCGGTLGLVFARALGADCGSFAGHSRTSAASPNVAVQAGAASEGAEVIALRAA